MSILIQNSINYTPNVPDSKHIILYVNEDGNICVLNSQNHITNLSELNGDYYKKPIDEVITYPISSLKIDTLAVGYRVIVENSGIIYEVCQNKDGQKFWNFDNHHAVGAMVFIRNVAILNKYYYVYDGKKWNRTNYSNNNSHTIDYSNPHRVTKEQVGLGNVENITLIPIAQFEEHLATNNPHRVTKEQIGLGNVENVILVPATALSEHLATNNPHRVTKEQIGLGNVENEPQVNVREYKEHIKDYNNPHGWTKEDFGLGNLSNGKIYPKTKFKEHTSATNPHRVTKEQLGLGSVENIEHTTETEYIQHKNASNPHRITKEQLGLGNIENVSQVSIEEFNDHTSATNPHQITKEDIGLGMIQNENLLSKADFDTHTSNHSNPHQVTKKDIGLGDVLNVRQLSKQAFDEHVLNHDNPHRVSINDIGLSNILNKPSVSKETWNNGQHTHRTTAVDVGLELVVNTELIEESVLTEHLNQHNPHQVTKEDIGLGNVDNTADINKPVSTLQQIELDKKADVKITIHSIEEGEEVSIDPYDKAGNISPEIMIPTVNDVVVPVGCFKRADGQVEPTLQLFSPLDSYYTEQFKNIHTVQELLSSIQYGGIKIKGLSTLIIHVEGNELEHLRLFDDDRIIIYVNDYYKRTVTYGVFHNHKLPEGDELINKIRELTVEYNGIPFVNATDNGLMNVTTLATNYWQVSQTQYKGEVYGIPFLDQVEIQYKNNFRKVLGYPLKTTMLRQSPIIGMDVLQLGDGIETVADSLGYLQQRNGITNVQEGGYDSRFFRNNSVTISRVDNNKDCDYAIIIFNGEATGYRSIFNGYTADNTAGLNRDQKFKCIDVLYPITAGTPIMHNICVISTSLIDTTIKNNTAIRTENSGTVYYVKSTVENKLIKIWNVFNDTRGFNYVLIDLIPNLEFTTTIEAEFNKLTPNKQYKFIGNKTDDELKAIANDPNNEVWNGYEIIKKKNNIYCLTNQSLIKYERLNGQQIANPITLGSNSTILVLVNDGISIVLSYSKSIWSFELYSYGHIIPNHTWSYSYTSPTNLYSMYDNKGKAANGYTTTTNWGSMVSNISPNIGMIPSPINPYVGHFLYLNPNNTWYSYLFHPNGSSYQGRNYVGETNIDSITDVLGKLHPFNNEQRVIGYIMISSGIVLLLNDGSVWKGELNYKLLSGEQYVRPLMFTKMLDSNKNFIAIHSMFNHNVLLIDDRNNLTILNPYTSSTHVIEQRVIDSNQSIVACNSFAYFSVIVTANVRSGSNVISVYYFDHLSETLTYTGISDWVTDDLSTIRIRMTNGSKANLDYNQLAGNYISIHGSDDGILIPWNPYSTYTLDPEDPKQKLSAVLGNTIARPMYNTTSRYGNLLLDNNINRINIENDNIYYKYKN